MPIVLSKQGRTCRLLIIIGGAKVSDFNTLILTFDNSEAFSNEIISCPVYQYISASVSSAGGKCFISSQHMQGENIITANSAGSAISEFLKGVLLADRVLLFFSPVPAVSVATLSRFTAEESCTLYAGNTPVAAWLTGDEANEYGRTGTLPREQMPIPPGEGLLAIDCESIYAIQEGIRRKINLGHMKNGVTLVDPNTTYISPMAKIEAGTKILQNCQIHGKTVIGSRCVIGPNTVIDNSNLGEDVKVNASQIYQSSIGSKTTVGPFAYIRPQCEIGENVRIGDFVELKKSKVGNGTKVSHLAYIGDSDFGENINVSCGAVTVNYDGKVKYKTVVEDGCFVGCNVNLVAPVKIGKGAYLAAGSTITEDVQGDALAIARSRQVVKPQWVKRRKESGKL